MLIAPKASKLGLALRCLQQFEAAGVDENEASSGRDEDFSAVIHVSEEMATASAVFGKPIQVNEECRL